MSGASMWLEPRTRPGSETIESKTGIFRRCNIVSPFQSEFQSEKWTGDPQALLFRGEERGVPRGGLRQVAPGLFGPAQRPGDDPRVEEQTHVLSALGEGALHGRPRLCV